MGQQYSQPKPGVTPLVICAGLPRTGTASLAAALTLLLDGPVYHGGTQLFLGPPSEIQAAIQILNRWPSQSPTQLAAIDRLFGAGYIALADAPACALLPELLTLYPDAKVLVTTRDIEKWEASMVRVSSASTPWFLRAVLWPLPTMRHAVDYLNALRRQWLALYGETEPPTRRTYERHMEWMREVVPKEKLVFVNVQDGWGPVCEALGREVPKGVEFPWVNDGKAIEEFAGRMVMQGLFAWGKIVGLGVMSFVVVIGWRRLAR